jgi:hypothetical protein
MISMKSVINVFISINLMKLLISVFRNKDQKFFLFNLQFFFESIEF